MDGTRHLTKTFINTNKGGSLPHPGRTHTPGVQEEEEDRGGKRRRDSMGDGEGGLEGNEEEEEAAQLRMSAELEGRRPKRRAAILHPVNQSRQARQRIKDAASLIHAHAPAVPIGVSPITGDTERDGRVRTMGRVGMAGVKVEGDSESEEEDIDAAKRLMRMVGSEELSGASEGEGGGAGREEEDEESESVLSTGLGGGPGRRGFSFGSDLGRAHSFGSVSIEELSHFAAQQHHLQQTQHHPHHHPSSNLPLHLQPPQGTHISSIQPQQDQHHSPSNISTTEPPSSPPIYPTLPPPYLPPQRLSDLASISTHSYRRNSDESFISGEEKDHLLPTHNPSHPLYHPPTCPPHPSAPLQPTHPHPPPFYQGLPVFEPAVASGTPPSSEDGEYPTTITPIPSAVQGPGSRLGGTVGGGCGSVLTRGLCCGRIPGAWSVAPDVEARSVEHRRRGSSDVGATDISPLPSNGNAFSSLPGLNQTHGAGDPSMSFPPLPAPAYTEADTARHRPHAAAPHSTPTSRPTIPSPSHIGACNAHALPYLPPPCHTQTAPAPSSYLPPATTHHLSRRPLLSHPTHPSNYHAAFPGPSPPSYQSSTSPPSKPFLHLSPHPPPPLPNHPSPLHPSAYPDHSGLFLTSFPSFPDPPDLLTTSSFPEQIERHACPLPNQTNPNSHPAFLHLPNLPP